MSSMKPDGNFRRLRTTLVVSVLGWAVIGCFYGFEHRDVLTNRPECWGGFRPGQTYELLQDVFCIDGELDSYYKCRADARDVHNPPQKYWPLTLPQYREMGIKDERVHIVSAGTRIRCSKIAGYRNVGVSLITVYGVILDGPNDNKEVSFGSLTTADQSSSQAKPYGTLQPRPEFLRAMSVTD